MSKSTEQPKPWQVFRESSPRWLRPFLKIEWYTEWLVYWLRRWAFVDLIQIVAGLSFLWAAVSYALSADERRQAREDERKAKHYQAWQAIHAAEGTRGSGGRIDALHDLARDSVSLAGVDLSSAILDTVRFSNLDFSLSKWDSAELRLAHFQDADLSGASLRDVSLIEGCLNGVLLPNADLRGATLVAADLSGATLAEADLRNAHLGDANLSGAGLWGADLRGAVIDENVRTVTQLDGANVYGAVASPDFFAWAGASMDAVCIASDEEWMQFKDLFQRGSAAAALDAVRASPARCNPGSAISVRRFILSTERHRCDTTHAHPKPDRT